MSRQSQGFLRTWLLVGIVITLVVGVFDAIMDPYLVIGASRINGFNARKPAVDTYERLIKAYDVLRAAPNTLILGGSRVDMGLDAQDSAWPAQVQPVYNLGLASGSPYVSYRYLQHVMSRRHIPLVVLGLEFEYFLGLAELGSPVEPEFELHLAVTRAGSPNGGQRWQHIRDLFQATLSLDALTDSAATLAANFNGESSDVVAGNWNTDLSDIALLGPYPVIVEEDLGLIRIPWEKERIPLVMADVRAILDLCESHGTSVILFINPSYADDLEILDLRGYWQAFEDWKRELVTLTSKYVSVDGRSRIRLWDFTGYDPYSTESMPLNRHLLHWFIDDAHYTRALGDVIVRRFFGPGDPRFGVLLSAENVDQHLAEIREQQRQYRQHRPADARRVRDLYDFVVGISPQAVVRGQ
jgi:hypothetical protein